MTDAELIYLLFAAIFTLSACPPLLWESGLIKISFHWSNHLLWGSAFLSQEWKSQHASSFPKIARSLFLLESSILFSLSLCFLLQYLCLSYPRASQMKLLLQDNSGLPEIIKFPIKRKNSHKSRFHLAVCICNCHKFLCLMLSPGPWAKENKSPRNFNHDGCETPPKLF